MKALTIPEPNEISLTDVDMPTCSKGEVRLRVVYGGYCGTDLNTFRGLNPLVTYPRILGHEISGVVETVGPGVPSEITVGTQALIIPYFNCGTCRPCEMGRPNACRNNETLGVQRDGALTEFVVLPWQKLVLADDLKLPDMALVEPIAVGCHAVWRGRVEPNETVVVLGAGAIGIGAALGALRRGATVISVDVSATKLEQIQKLGAQHTINATSQDVVAEVLALTGNHGAHLVIEAVGHPQTFVQAIDAVSSSGRVVYVGYAKEPVQYETKFFVMKEIDILGSRGAHRRDFETAIEILRDNPTAGDIIITQTVSLDEAPEAMRQWTADPSRFTKIMVSMEKGNQG